MPHFVPILSLIVWLPIAGAGCICFVHSYALRRSLAVAVSLATLSLTLWPLLFFDRHATSLQFVELAFRVPGLGMSYHLGLDGYTVLVLPTVALIALAVLVTGPRADVSRNQTLALLIAETCLLGTFCALDLALLAVFWVGALVPPYLLVDRDAAPPHEPSFLLVPAHPVTARSMWVKSRSAFRTFLLQGSVPLLVGVAVVGIFGLRSGRTAPFNLVDLAVTPIDPRWQGSVFALFIVPVVIRMAIFPFHAWLPLLLEKGPLGTAILLGNTHVGLYLLARVALPLFPNAPSALMPVLAVGGMISAIYGAVVAVAQFDLRRMLGYVAVSQSGLMLVGLASMNTQSVSGAVLESAASSLALGGLQLLTWSLNARTGTTDTRHLGGLVVRSPKMSACYLMFSVAAVGFPGSLAFVSEDLLLHGVLHVHPIVASLMLFATAINGITVLRSFYRAFAGPARREHRVAAPDSTYDLLPRERVIALFLLCIVFFSGFYPAPLLKLREEAVAMMVTHDAHVELGSKVHGHSH